MNILRTFFFIRSSTHLWTALATLVNKFPLRSLLRSASHQNRVLTLVAFIFKILGFFCFLEPPPDSAKLHLSSQNCIIAPTSSSSQHWQFYSGQMDALSFCSFHVSPARLHAWHHVGWVHSTPGLSNAHTSLQECCSALEEFLGPCQHRRKEKSWGWGLESSSHAFMIFFFLITFFYLVL